MPAEETSGCPRCHSKNSRVVFCPYCGAGMCANCTPLIKQVEGGFEYSCPKCSETIFVRKKAQ
jgi:NADH pyrophosphatase NudC (nudix superfamily)